MHLFEHDPHPMLTVHGYNQEILLWQPDEEEYFPGSCKQQYINREEKINVMILMPSILSIILTHIHQLKHKQELHCLVEYVHMQAVFDEMLSAGVLLPSHL